MRFPGSPRAFLSVAALTLVLAGGAPQVRAQEIPNHLYDRFQLNLSGSLLKIGTDARIDSKNGSIGTDLDVEDDLGFSDTKFQPRIELRWQPGRHHQIGVGYQLARRTGSKTLERTIDVGDTSFTAGARINSTFDSDNAFLTYRYAIVARENTQFGIGIGFGAFFFKVGVDALAGVSSGGASESVEYSSETDFVGPTSAVGLFGRFRLGERWYLDPDVRYLRVTIDRFTGQVVNVGVLGRYYVTPKLGIEAGLGSQSVQIDVGPKTDGTGIVDLDTSVYLKYRESQGRLGVVYAF